jgi:hypothetical protein
VAALPAHLYALMLYLFWRVLALMPRVKPAKIETGSSSARFDEVAGLDEAKAELLDRGVPAGPEALHEARRARPQGAASVRAARHR